MATCQDLSTQLNQQIQDRRALDDPNYCADNFPDNIHECLKNLGAQKRAADADIANTRNEIAVCNMLTGAWAFDGNGFTGTLNITSIDGVNGDGSIRFSGNAVIDAPRVDSIDNGVWNSAARMMTFQRHGIPGISSQTYTGFMFDNTANTQARVVAGTFTESDTSLVSGWFMSKSL